MRIFLDTANPEEIELGVKTGCVSGVTTNPTIISRENKPLTQCVADIAAIDSSITILVEAVSEHRDDMVAEARKLAMLGGDIVVKLPMTSEGLAAARILSKDSISTALTLVFCLNQAIAASCAGASYVAPFIGRLDDIGSNGLQLVQSAVQTFHAQNVETKVIAASVRSPQSVADLFAAGCDVVTMPYTVLDKMLLHPLTEAGLRKFEEDWKKVPSA